MAKSGRLELGEHFTDLQVYFQPLCITVIGLKMSNSVKKRKIRAITAFKVIEVGNNRKLVCDFLLVINRN